MMRALSGRIHVAKTRTKKAPKKASKKAANTAPTKKKAAPKKAAPKKAAPKKAAPRKVAPKKAAPKKAAPKKAAPKKAAVAATAKHTLPPREALTLETVLLASPERVYAAWIDGTEHSEFTGGEAIIDAREGGKHSAWSGYIEGRFVSLDPGKRLVMTWRTTEFDEADPDSELDLRFHADGGGTRLELVHTQLPPGGAQKYTTGWREFYFVPMQKYFG
jgi:uncharacterized protein YndB with AHSA1/START domain